MIRKIFYEYPLFYLISFMSLGTFLFIMAFSIPCFYMAYCLRYINWRFDEATDVLSSMDTYLKRKLKLFQ